MRAQRARGHRAPRGHGQEAHLAAADAARRDTRAFVADLAAGPSWAAGRRELRAVATPVSLVMGWRSSPVWQEATRALAGLMPSAKLIELEAGHLAMLEQPEAIAEAARACL